MKLLHLIFIGLLLAACMPVPVPPTVSPVPTSSPTPTSTVTPTSTITLSPTPLPPDPVLVGAGDISSCGSQGDDITANLLDSIEGTVFTTGDNVYERGTPEQFQECYDPTWGRHKARTRPSPGNHDYGTADASGYFNYFGALAGEPGLGYYSYDLGEWHIIVLNSNISVRPGSPQEQWLRADLAAHPVACTAAYWHHPRFSSGAFHGSDEDMQPLWQALYDYGADIVLNGHEHNYERFALQDPNGVADPIRGIREFVVGTGGRNLYFFGSPIPNSEVRNSQAFGLLKLTLHSGSYSWEFIPEPGETFTDSGNAPCVTPETPASIATLTAGTQGITFYPTDDATIQEVASNANLGSERRLKVDQGPQESFLLRFAVSGTGGRVARAILRLYNVNPSDEGVQLSGVADSSWSETSVTWNTAPAADPNLLSQTVFTGVEGWYEVDVSSFITGDGTYSFRADPASGDGADFSSKEADIELIPQLVVFVADNITPTP